MRLGLCDYLVVDQVPESADLIFVLAGRPERKLYGLQLFRQGCAPRLILSVGRFEVRQPQRFGLQCGPQLPPLSHSMPVERRHFFIDCTGESETIHTLPLKPRGTYSELQAFAHFLESHQGTAIKSIALVSTSVHLRRVRYCCQKIPLLRKRKLVYLFVPEDISSFRRNGWWKHPDHWSYLVKEYVKLVAYGILYRVSRRSSECKRLIDCGGAQKPASLLS